MLSHEEILSLKPGTLVDYADTADKADKGPAIYLGTLRDVLPGSVEGCARPNEDTMFHLIGRPTGDWRDDAGNPQPCWRRLTPGSVAKILEIICEPG